MLAAPQIMAQSKPEKLVYVGDNGPWHWTMVEEVAPEFESQTGIQIDFTLLPVDPWRARLRAELGAGSGGIDIVQWSVGMARLDRPHMEDHDNGGAADHREHPDFDWDDFLAGTKKAASYEGKLVGIPYRITTGILHYQKALMEQRRLRQPAGHLAGVPEGGDRAEHAAVALRLRHLRPPGRGDLRRLRAVALFQRRPAGRLQDRRDLHQRCQGRGVATVLCRPRDQGTRWCHRNR